MLELVAQFNRERSAAAKPPVELRIGIASGEVLAGECGTPRNAAYVCVGAAVERAARFAALAPSGCPALIDSATRTAVSGRLTTVAGQTAALLGSPEDGPAYALRAG
jgi:class 3 adenylate cyclase